MGPKWVYDSPTRHASPSQRPPLVQGYQIKHGIGQGAFSKVYCAQHPVSTELVAVKVIPYSGGELDSKMVKEVKMHKMLKHANILEVLGTDTDPDGKRTQAWGPAYFIILEYASGGDLFDKIGMSHRPRVSSC
jgi:serine/threonine-protein kinase Chk1